MKRPPRWCLGAVFGIPLWSFGGDSRVEVELCISHAEVASHSEMACHSRWPVATEPRSGRRFEVDLPMSHSEVA